jgi:serine/threonine protein kinase/Tol biopolymer transport system component
MSITAGTKLGPYEVKALLGAGGMGEVFRAHDSRIGRDVAIKVLPAAFAANDDRLRRFEQEARTAGSLNHPHLVTIYDIGREDGASYIVMELLDGVTLRERLASGGADLKKNLLGLADAADAVAAAHQAGVVHRDLKPENIMVTGSGFTKVLDFGLAKLAAESHSLQTADADMPTAVQQTGSGVVLGTVGYMSPEQAMGKPADNRSDIFALGCILYEVVTGHRAFAGKSSVDTLHDIIHNDPTPVRKLRPDVAPELQRIIRKCLSKDADERYQSAKDLAIDLRAAVRELGSSPEMQAATPRRAAMWLAIGFAIAAVAAIGAWYLTRGRHSSAAKALTIRPLTTSGDVIGAAISPDGKYLAYANSSEGLQGIFLRQIGTSQSITLVPPLRGGIWGMAFSPDGSTIDYGVKARGDAAGAVYSMATLGGAPRRILSGMDSLVSFAPDGSRFAYLRADFPKQGRSAVMVANADGSNAHPIALKTSPDIFAPIFFGAPAWSPDGKTIVAAVVRPTGTEQGRYVAIDPSSGAERPLTKERWRFASQAVWVGDGRRLIGVGTATDEVAGQLYEIDYPSGDVQRLTSGVTDWRNPSITADGKKLVAIGSNRSSTIALIPPGGGAAKRVSATQVDGMYGIAFAPDGRLVFTTVGASGVDLVVANADGSGRQQIPIPGALVREPVIAPDGTLVCIVANKDGVGVWRMNLDGSGATRIADATGPSTTAMSPDGSTVYFHANLQSGDILYRVPVRGGAATPVSSLTAVAPSVSPDGKLLAAFITPPGKPPHLAIMDAATGTVVREFEPQLASTTHTAWAPDGKTIYYNSGPSLFAVPVAGGEAVAVAHYDSPNSVYRFAVARDGTIAVVYGLLNRDAYLITGFD